MSSDNREADRRSGPLTDGSGRRDSERSICSDFGEVTPLAIRHYAWVFSLLGAVEMPLAIAGACFIIGGIVVTAVVLKWPGYKGGGFFVPNLRPSLAIVFGSVFWLAGAWMLWLSLNDPVVVR